MEKDRIIVGIDASRNRSSGAKVHLIGILTEGEAGVTQAILDLLKDGSRRDTLGQEGKGLLRNTLLRNTRIETMRRSTPTY